MFINNVNGDKKEKKRKKINLKLKLIAKIPQKC